MVVVPASFLSQEWINMVSMKPSQRHFNAVATGKRIHDTLTDPNEDIVQKRSNFLDELGDFNDFNRKHFGKPPAFRLKAKENPNSKDYQNVDLSNLVGRQQPNVHAFEATNQSPSKASFHSPNKTLSGAVNNITSATSATTTAITTTTAYLFISHETNASFRVSGTFGYGR